MGPPILTGIDERDDAHGEDELVHVDELGLDVDEDPQTLDAGCEEWGSDESEHLGTNNEW